MNRILRKMLNSKLKRIIAIALAAILLVSICVYAIIAIIENSQRENNKVSAIEKFEVLYNDVLDTGFDKKILSDDVVAKLDEMKSLIDEYGLDAEYIEKSVHADDYYDELEFLEFLETYTSNSALPLSDESIDEFIKINKKIILLKSDKNIDYFTKNYDDKLCFTAENILIANALYKIQQYSIKTHPGYEFHSAFYINNKSPRSPQTKVLARGHLGRNVSVVGTRNALESGEQLSALENFETSVYTQQALDKIDALNNGTSFFVKMYDPEGEFSIIDDSFPDNPWNKFYAWYAGFNMSSYYEDGQMVYEVKRYDNGVESTVKLTYDDILDYTLVNLK